MNTMKAIESRPNSNRWMPQLWLIRIIILVCILISILAFSVVSWQWTSKRTLQDKMKEWSQLGLPYDATSSDQEYRKSTHPEGTDTWIKFLQMADWGGSFSSVNELPIVGTSDTKPANLADGEWPADWPAEVLVENYLKEMEPFFALIDEAKSFPTPVEIPIHFQGVGTLLEPWQKVCHVARILQLECEYALYKKDSARTMRAIRGMDLARKAFYEPKIGVIELICMAIANMEHQVIQHASACNFFSKDDLEQLRLLVHDMKFDQSRWKHLVFSDLAMVFSSLDLAPSDLLSTDDFIWITPFLDLPSSRLRLAEAIESIAALGDTPIDQLVSVSEQVETRILEDSTKGSLDGSQILIRLVMPSAAGYARAIVRNEDSRRMTLTSLALRTYQKQKGTWPTQLSDLEQIGLSRQEYNTVNAGTLGYQFDGKSVWLWSYSLRPTQSPVLINPIERPTEELIQNGTEQVLQLW